ncbi:metal-independent alpha-mannosidase, partial [Flavobacterium sp. LBUM151]
MNSRRKFIKNTGIFSAGLLAIQADAFGFNSDTFNFALKDFISQRPPLAERKFTSPAIEAAIVKIKKQIANPELAWL